MTSQKKPNSAKKKPGPTGPTKPFSDANWEKLIAFIEIQATAEECAAYFRIDIKTLNRRIKEREDTKAINFSQLYKKHSKAGNLSIRRAQHKAAEAGSIPMLIWLGKQLLGQRDKPADENTVGDIHVHFDDFTDNWGKEK